MLLFHLLNFFICYFNSVKSSHLQYGPYQNATDDVTLLNDYPLPPVNISQKTYYVDNEEKIMATTISWDAEPDFERKYFSLRIEAVGLECRSEFPGYINDRIPPSHRSFRIPFELEDTSYTALEIMHDCQYIVTLRSNPFPPNNIPGYVTQFNFTVPHCVQGRCSCKDHTPPTVKNVEVLVIKQDRVIVPLISWYHPEANRTAFRYEVGIYLNRENYFKDDEDYDYSEKGKNHNNTEGINGYLEDRDMIERTMMKEQNLNSKKGNTKYSLLWPSSLQKNEEYVVFIYAKNKHLCLSLPATKKFTTFKDNLVNIEDISESIADDLYASQSSSQISSIHKSGYGLSATNGTIVKVDSSSNSLWIFAAAWVILSTVLLFLCCTCLFLIRKYCVQNGKSEIEKSSIIPWAMAHSSHSMLETNILYRRAIETKSKGIIYEIPSNQIQVGAVIGQGAFGMVCMGTVMGIEGFGRPTTVAVKQLNGNAEDFQKNEFTAELDIMKQVGRHPNIVAMYGFCNEPNHQCMVMEYVPFGDLKHYLQELRKQFDLVVYNKKNANKFEFSSSPSTSLNSAFINTNDKIPATNDSYYLDPNELQSFALQVACGMGHIESLGIIHRDLAARNILVGRGKQLKISDFGLSRRGVYVKTSKGIIPLRWLSIEAIEHNLYSTKSDVWAYGIVLWEICTLAGFPYAAISDKELLKHLQQGNRLEKPSSCANEIYDIMMKCWAEEPTERPSFAALCEYLNELNNQECPYVEFLPDEELPPPDIPSECENFEASSTVTTEQKENGRVITAAS